MRQSQDRRGAEIHDAVRLAVGAPNRRVQQQIGAGQGAVEPVEQERIAEAQEAERQRIADEQQAKKDALEAARQKRLAAERRKKQADEDARYAKIRAEIRAKEAEEQAKIRLACAAIYKATSDKKMGDLTVKEDQQVRACQSLGLYPPR